VGRSRTAPARVVVAGVAAVAGVKHSSGTAKPPKMGAKGYEVLEDAPGQYVHMK